MADTPIRNRMMNTVDEAFGVYRVDIARHCDEMDGVETTSRNDILKRLEEHRRNRPMA